MWKIFQESVWSFLLGKVVSVLGVVGTVQTVISLFNPAYVISVVGIKIDYIVWFILTLLLLVGIILRVLQVASGYKHSLEAKDKISIIYNEKYHLACRQEHDAIEVIRLGIRVIGKSAVENVEVFPKHLYYRSRAKSKKRRINRFALKPMISTMLSRPINPGIPSTCFVDLLKHKMGTRELCFCYDGLPDEYLSYNAKNYELEVEARGGGNQHGYKILFLSFNEKNGLMVNTAKGDDL